MIEPARLLGFAFANADLLVEVDASGTILFAGGATRDYAAEGIGNLVGQPGGTLFQPAEGSRFTAFAGGLHSGGRAGPMQMKLATGGEATLSMFRLPENGGRISCTLARATLPAVIAPDKDADTGLANRDGFLAEADEIVEDSDELALINIPGLPQICAQLEPQIAQQLLQRIGTTIRESGVKAGGRLSPSSFCAIANAMDGRNPLGASIRKALKEGGISQLPIQETLISLEANGLSPDQRMLAVRYVVDRFCAANSNSTDMPGNLLVAFDRIMTDTHSRVQKLLQTVAEGRFRFEFQPIVNLKTGAVSHHEALSRFEPNENTGEVMAFAEALGVVDAFDLAAAIKLIGQLERPEHTQSHVALNLSGHTIASPPAFGLLAGLLARHRKLAPRLLIEITETAEITDLVAANAAIQTLRRMGHRVGIDDFGAGAASLQYLHAFAVDFVKIDGKLIRQLGVSAREDMLLRGIVKLCAELGVETVAEYVEDEDKFTRARQMGFDYGQGHYFSVALAELPPDRSAVAGATTHRAKRMGVQEGWG
jgi:EAL domain-containing protein (putative c-di-GMP-specific phosphodiesterase class I)